MIKCKTKHECRTCRFWKSEYNPNRYDFLPAVFVKECTNPKSKRYQTTPLYDSKCDKWKKT